MTTWSVSRTIEERDEVNKDAFKLNAYSLIEDGELQQKVEYISITIYELVHKKKGSFDNGRFDKMQKGHIQIPVSALKFIIGDSS